MEINAHPVWLPALCGAAMVLLVFASVSVPTWSQVSFLNVGPTGPDQLQYGIFGYTRNQINNVTLGYDFILTTLNTENPTKAFILHPIAAGVSAFAVLLAIHSGKDYPTNDTRIYAVSLCAWLAFSLTAIVFMFDIVLFTTARNKYHDAELGNGVWLTLGATVTLLAAFVVALPRVLSTFKTAKNN